MQRGQPPIASSPRAIMAALGSPTRTEARSAHIEVRGSVCKISLTGGGMGPGTIDAPASAIS